MLLGGALVWIWCAVLIYRHGRAALASKRMRELPDPDRADAPVPSAQPIPGVVLVLCGLAVWLIQPMGAAMSLALLGSPANPDAPSASATPTLRDSAAASFGAYLFGVAIIAGMAFVLPGVWRAIGASLPLRALGKCLGQSAVWSVGAGLAVYLVGALAVWGAEIISTWRGTEGPGNVAHSTLSKLLEPADAASGSGFLGHDVWWWGTVLGVTVGAPIIEEFIYRGFIQTGLLRLTRSGPAAILATSLMFALAHWSAVEAHALATLFVLSLCFGMALEKTGKLWVCVLMHAAFNIGNIVMAMG
jgi:membrane protease YdiL (CAAX protease family)